MSRELKPCPFCGGRAIVSSSRMPIAFWAYCTNEKCGAEVNGRSTPEGTAELWNARALAPSIDAEAVELLRRLVKWDIDFPPNCWNGYVGLKELDKIIAEAKTATGFDGFTDALAPAARMEAEREDG